MAAAVSGVILLLSLGWVSRKQVGFPPLIAQLAEPVLSPASQVETAQTDADEVPVRWAEPHGPAAEAWTFELFTPPPLIYQPDAGIFTTARPANVPIPSATTGEEWRLRQIRRAAFRLQLAGYFGGPEDYLAAFVAPGTAQTWLVRTGYRFPGLGLTLLRLNVRRVTAPDRESSLAGEMVAEAELRDEPSGTVVSLSTRQWSLTDKLQAVIDTPESMVPYVVSEGEVLMAGSNRWRAERIQTEPPVLTLARLDESDAVVERRMLRATNPE